MQIHNCVHWPFFFSKNVLMKKTLLMWWFHFKVNNIIQNCPQRMLGLYLKSLNTFFAIFPCQSKFQGWLTCSIWDLMPFLCQFKFIGYWFLDWDYLLPFNYILNMGNRESWQITVRVSKSKHRKHCMSYLLMKKRMTRNIIWFTTYSRQTMDQQTILFLVSYTVHSFTHFNFRGLLRSAN